jgi:hypothetical protein
MNSPKSFTEIVGDENKENAIASVPNIQEPSSTVKPGTSPIDTKSNSNDDEVRIESRNNNAYALRVLCLTAFLFLFRWTRPSILLHPLLLAS